MQILNILKLLTRNKVGLVGLIGLTLFVLLVLLGPLFIPLDDEAHVTQIYQPPSAQHWLGTDRQGRDTWSHIVYGGKDILYIALVAGAISTSIAVVGGALAALIGGVLDTVIMTLSDIVLTVPRFPILAVLAAVVRFDNPLLLAVLIGVLAWPPLLRAIRAQVLSLRERDYIEAARALDLGTRHIIAREILPNLMSYILISLIFAMTAAIYEQVGLIFLGLAPLSGQNWGVMINYAYGAGAIWQKDSIYYIMSPVLAIALFQLLLVSTARSLEEIFNPRLRTGI